VVNRGADVIDPRPVLLTQGVDSLPADTKARLLTAVRSFNNFTKDNDPYEEHDFGSIELEGVTYFFKHDYYAPDMEGGPKTRGSKALPLLRSFP
jgi:Protein of unknown function (DUF3768)